MDNKTKEAWFWMYCKHCKNAATPESEDPCDECLSNPANIDSHKPVNYQYAGEGDGPVYDSTEERKSHE